MWSGLPRPLPVTATGDSSMTHSGAGISRLIPDVREVLSIVRTYGQSRRAERAGAAPGRGRRDALRIIDRYGRRQDAGGHRSGPGATPVVRSVAHLVGHPAGVWKHTVAADRVSRVVMPTSGAVGSALLRSPRVPEKWTHAVGLGLPPSEINPA
jgi:hypothetical protein